MTSRHTQSSRQPGLLAAALAALITLGLGGRATAQDELAFVRGLEWTRSLMAEERWGAARSRIQGLLAQHKGRSYARVRRDGIIESMTRCQFHLAGRAPRADQLTSGDLVRHSERAGELTLRYQPDTLGDFERAGEQSGVRFHPATFTGRYRVDVEARDYPSTPGGIRVVVNESPEHATVVSFGLRKTHSNASSPMTIYRLNKDGERTPLADPIRSLTKPGQRYTVSVQVNAATIQALVNGRPALTVNKPKDEYGRVGLFDVNFDELELSGKASPAWLQGLVDSRLQREFALFKRSYDERGDLPAWLFADDEPRSQRNNAPKNFPGVVEREHVSALSRASALLREGDHEAARDLVLGLQDAEISRAARAYLLAICAFSLNDYQAAVGYCDAASREDGVFAGARLLRARAHAQLRQTDAAVEQLRALLRDHPQHEAAHTMLALQLLQAGEPEQARTVVRSAQRHGVETPELEKLGRMLMMAESGPAWRRSWTYRSANYVVSSDVSQSVCVETARMLERCLVSYQAQLAPVRKKSGPFKVFVFSGEASYRSYCADVLGAPSPHSMGLFSSALKQLLVRNVADHETMLETVRHEGLHQYLDGVMADPPAWLNEGLAMYYEASRPGEPRPRGGVMRADLLATLQQREMAPLATLTELTLDEFYADSELHYPQSWAFVHFLRDTKKSRRVMFRRIFDALLAGRSNAEALRAGLGETPLAELDAEFREHVMSMSVAAPGGAPR